MWRLATLRAQACDQLALVSVIASVEDALQEPGILTSGAEDLAEQAAGSRTRQYSRETGLSHQSVSTTQFWTASRWPTSGWAWR